MSAQMKEAYIHQKAVIIWLITALLLSCGVGDVIGSFIRTSLTWQPLWQCGYGYGYEAWYGYGYETCPPVVSYPSILGWGGGGSASSSSNNNRQPTPTKISSKTVVKPTTKTSVKTTIKTTKATTSMPPETKRDTVIKAIIAKLKANKLNKWKNNPFGFTYTSLDDVRYKPSPKNVAEIPWINSVAAKR